MSDATMDVVRDSFLRSPKKSTRRASRELRILQATVVKILHKRFNLHA